MIFFRKNKTLIFFLEVTCLQNFDWNFSRSRSSISVENCTRITKKTVKFTVWISLSVQKLAKTLNIVYIVEIMTINHHKTWPKLTLSHFRMKINFGVVRCWVLLGVGCYWVFRCWVLLGVGCYFVFRCWVLLGVGCYFIFRCWVLFGVGCYSVFRCLVLFSVLLTPKITPNTQTPNTGVGCCRSLTSYTTLIMWHYN